MAGYDLGFGVDPSTYDFLNPAGDDPGGVDPNASYMEKALRAMQARNMVKEKMAYDPPPDPVSIPRVKDEAAKQQFFQKNPGLAKGIDALAMILQTMNRQKIDKKNKNAWPHGQHTNSVPLGALPYLTPQVNKTNALQNEDSQKVQKDNAGIAETEARINESAMNRYMGRRTAELGQMVPSMTRAAMRDPKEPRAAPVYQQKLETLKQNEAYLNATPAQRNAMELHVIGAEPKTAQDAATAYKIAAARFQAKIDVDKRNPGGGKPKDLAEVDVADAARYMGNLVYNDYVDPETAADMAVTFMRNKQKLRVAVGKNPTTVAPPQPMQLKRTGPPPPQSPAGGSYVDPGLHPQLPPEAQTKLQTYERYIKLHPERKQELRDDFIRSYGIDPDTQIGMGN